MAKRSVEKMDKSELRAACKAAGISYSKLTVAGMREALLAKQAPAPVVITTPAPEPAPVLLSGVTTAEREVRNGIKRPKEGGLCAAVWTDLDKLLASGTEPTTSQVRDLAAARSWNVNNATAELSAWRKFNGLSKQTSKPGPRRKSAAKLAGLPRMSAEEVVPYTA